MKITVEKSIVGTRDQVWEAWNNPDDIKQWNAASDDWHTPRSTVDLREGGTFTARMEAKDGSVGFDFTGTYTRIVPNETIEYRMEDGREVKVEFIEQGDSVLVRETCDAETENPADIQRHGWQSILDSFARHVEAQNARVPSA
jgi:uncharacterized protein YndB with AHSA1/START domain